MIDDVLDRLDAVRRSGTGWMARCPAHDDRDPSLSVSEGDDGRVLIKCHAGCNVRSVVEAAGLTMADLAPTDPNTAGKGARSVVATYQYRDELGEVRFEVVRYSPKDFCQRRPDGNGGWIWDMEGVRRILYNLPEVLIGIEFGTAVHVVEGEKDAETLAALGLTATTFAGGAGKIDRTPDGITTLSKARHVIVVADADDPGRVHAIDLASRLREAGCAIVDVFEPIKGKDITDAIVTHGLVLNDALTTLDTQHAPPSMLDIGRLQLLDLLRRGPVDAEWLLEPLIPAKRHTAITAGAKTGKSLLLLEAAAALATGREFLDRPAGDPIRVLYLDYEMTEDDIQDRLVAMAYGAESSDNQLLAENLVYYQYPVLDPLDTASGAVGLLMMLDRYKPAIVVIDTLSRVVQGAENDSDTYRALVRHTTSKVKARGVAMVTADHTGHTNRGRARGSSAKNDLVDVAWTLTATDGGVKVKCTHKRVPWIPEAVVIGRHEDAPIHRLGASSWPHGTKECAELLDRAAIPSDFGERRAREALKAAGHLAPRAVVLRAAVKFRKLETRSVAPIETRPSGAVDESHQVR